MHKILLMSLAIMLSGCAVGIQQGKEYPSETFAVPIGYQEAYRRADAQPRKCFPGLTTAGDLFTDNHTGIVRSFAPGVGGESMNIRVQELTPGQTKVTVTVWGVGYFDQAQLDAVRESIESGNPICREPKDRR